MDYVVAGFGFGALLALIGFALWELFGDAEEPGISWLSKASIGAMLGALVVWAVTGVTLLSTLDDAMASRLVLLTSLVTVGAIAAGAGWYWWADRAYAPVVEPPTRTAGDREPRVAAAERDAEVEPNEWDVWPERQASVADDAVDEPVDVAAVAFEAEVAAAPVALDNDVGSEAEPNADRASPEAAVAPNGGENVDDLDPPSSPSSPIVKEGERDEPATEELRFESTPVSIEAPALESHDETVETDRAVASSDTDSVAELDAEVDTSVEEIVPDTQTGPETEETIELPQQPAGFESALLADIDGAAVETNGRFASPLLADLVPNPDELEGVGLPKWRSERGSPVDDGEDRHPHERSR